MATERRGKVTILADEAGLAAELYFYPEDEGDVVTIEVIQQALSEKNISTGFSPGDLEKALELISKSGSEGTKLIIAKGTPPEEAAVFEWKELEVPGSMKDDSEAILKSAPPVLVFREWDEKIPTQKKVVKKGKPPFARRKEETVTVMEKVTQREAVEVDTKILGTGLVAKGDILVSIEPGKPGKLGKNIFGKPILPKLQVEEAIFLGEGVIREGSTIKATRRGFMRRGNNWVEVISFQHHEWTVILSRDKSTVFFNFTPGDRDGKAPKASEVLDEAVALGVRKESLLSEKALRKIINQAVSSGTPLPCISISRNSDAIFNIEIDERNMKATLHVLKGQGEGKPLSLKDLGNAIKQSGFKGMNFAKIKEDILAFYCSHDMELRDYPLAQGKEPQTGETKTLKFTIDLLDPKITGTIIARCSSVGKGADIPSLEEFPISDAEDMAFVAVDTTLAQLEGEGKPEPGYDIFGKPVEVTPDQTQDVRLLENLYKDGNSIVAKSDGVLEVFTKDGIRVLRVRKHRDCEVSIRLSDDKMMAQLMLFAAEGTGEPLTLEMVSEKIKEAGVVKGLNSTAITHTFEEAKETGKSNEVIIAMGNPPQNAGMSRIDFKIDLATGDAVVINGSGKADFRKQDRITPVKKDEVIAEILTPEVKPLDGWDVQGNALKASAAPPLTLQIGNNIRKEEREPGIISLIADKNGELIYDERKIEVRDAHLVKGDIDMSQGNVKFSGSVQITGTVRSGFSVFSGGDIMIGEGVECALLSAEGSISIKQGIIGAGKAVLRAKENVEFAFAEQTTVLAVGDVNIQNSALKCDIKCNGLLTLQSEKGNLLGGSVRSRGGLKAMNIGSEKGIETRISFGQNYLIADQIEAEEREIQKIRDHILKLDSMMRQLERDGDRRRLSLARQTKLKYMKIIEKRSVRLFSLRENFEEHHASEIVVRGTIFPGVVIESHGRFYEVDKPKKHITITFNSETGHIEETEVERSK